MRILLCLLIITFAWAIPVNTLIENSKTYDQKTVTITGEVIGDILDRGDVVWLNVLSGEGTVIGVKTNKQSVLQIKNTGNYRTHGDTVLVTGVFYRANKLELGETMLESTDVQLIAPGYATPEVFSYKTIVLALVLVLFTLFLAAFYNHQFLPKKSKQTA